MQSNKDGKVIGSSNSRYSTSSYVMATHTRYPGNKPQLDILSLSNVMSYWFAAVYFYFDHQCRVWFGYPCEVWSYSTVPDLILIPISFISCLVALCELEVDFGRVIGKQKVFVVSPLSDSYFLHKYHDDAIFIRVLRSSCVHQVCPYHCTLLYRMLN